MNTRKKVFGIAIVMLLALTTAPGAVPQYQVLHPFTGAIDDGLSPQDASVVIDAANNVYGTTFCCGAANSFGTVYTMKSDGTGFHLLHAFAPSTDGGEPDATLLLDGSAGVLYGTTYGYGPTRTNSGTVFKIGIDGSGFQVIHAFAGGAADGAQPAGSLVLDGSGNLFGTTMTGGTSNLGTVFKVKTDGTGFSVLHSFGGAAASDGANPFAGLVLESGRLYGTTRYGGLSDAGTVYTLTPGGAAYAVLHHFDSGYPKGLVSDGAGGLYGTSNDGALIGGSVFRIRTDGSGYQFLHEFSREAPEGYSPNAALILDGAGNLFGTTMFGGAGLGTVFTLKTDGSGFSFLYNFADYTSTGGYPRAELALDGTGALYGTTQSGGSTADGGVVFKVTGVSSDTRPPTVSCSPPASTGWSAANVIVNCTASDSGFGLANPADASFTLSTSVPLDTETANAFTDSRQVCDLAGNCAPAGPFGPYMIDRKPPTITINSPVNNDMFSVGQPVAADYRCGDGGSGVVVCQGPVPNGAAIDTATPGPKTFTVNASDLAGNPASLQVDYTVIIVRSVSTIRLGSSASPSLVGQPVTITATVTGSAPTGTVTFAVDNGPSVTGTITSTDATTLTATIQINLPAGPHSISASYLGDVNNYPSGPTTVAQNVEVGESSGTATRAILQWVTNNITFNQDTSDGHFAAGPPSTTGDLSAGNSFAQGQLPQLSETGASIASAGPAVGANSNAFLGSNQAAARAIAFATYINQGSQSVTAHANAALTGYFTGPSISHASGALYVFDMTGFLNVIDASPVSLKQFLLGGDTLADYAAGTEASLSLVPRFTSVDPSTFKAKSFQILSSAGGNSPPPTPVQTGSFDVGPGQSVIVVFDLTVYSPSSGGAHFNSTLKPASVFFTDPAGNPVTLTPGELLPPPPPAAHLALTPASSTLALTTPVTLTATATTTSGAPVANTQVSLDIIGGPNTQPLGPSVTDASGQITFTYAGGGATGTDQIQASIGTLQSNVAQIAWTAGPLDHITIRPATATITTVGSQAYTAQAFDAFNNSIGDVTTSTAFGISPDGSCAGASCTASVAGPHVVTGTYSGKTATATLNVTGVTSSTFTFQGFFQPIDMSTANLVVWNTVKAGQGVPVKWLLTLNGTPVSDPTSFVGLSSYPIACSSGAGSTDDAIEQTATGGSGLQDNGSGNWQYTWQSLSSYKNSCRAVVVKFSDGTMSPAANFKFK